VQVRMMYRMDGNSIPDAATIHVSPWFSVPLSGGGVGNFSQSIYTCGVNRVVDVRRFSGLPLFTVLSRKLHLHYPTWRWLSCGVSGSGTH